MQEYIRAYEISDEHHMPRIIDRDNGPLSGAARLSRGTECHEEYELYVFFCPELMPRPSFESDFGFRAKEAFVRPYRHDTCT